MPSYFEATGPLDGRSAPLTELHLILRNVTLPAPRHRYTFEEYLDLEEIAAMAAAITAALSRQLGGTPCRVYSSDLRVRVTATGLATYPDVTVICGPSERDPESQTHVTNPKLIVEVSSPSTADYDRGEKLQHYQEIPSLELVLLFHHTGPRVDLWARGPEGWRSQRFGAGESIRLEAISCTLAVDEMYAAARGA